MKKLLPFFSLAILITACTANPGETETKTLQSSQQNQALDTAGLAAFQQWKAQNELASVTLPEQQEQPVAQAPVKTVTIIREVRVQQPAPARKTVRKQTPASVQERPAPVEEAQPAPSGNSDVASNSGSGSSTADTPAQQPEKAKKEGMSNAAKGAAVGGAGGAVIGAVLNKKNRGVGAVIGGVIGGAVGYGIGKKKDNKEAEQ